MKTFVYILGVCIGMYSAHGQETSKADKTTNEISFSFDGDLSFSGNENMYFSTSDSDDMYRVRARFPDRKTRKIRSYLKEELGEESMRVSGSRAYWKVEYSGDTGYEVQVDDGSLRIYIDKELISSSMLNKLKTITKNIKNYTSGKSEEKHKEAKQKQEEERLNREAEKLLREAERKTREAESLQREAERMKREAAKKTD